MKKDRKYTITIDLLKEYKENAFRNAQLLFEEAKILLSHNKFPGAYFLGCATIEECGKAFLAFNSINRNLSDPGIQYALKIEFENHVAKIALGLNCLLFKDKIEEKHISQFLDLAINLYFGREKSIYADINDDNTLTLPENLINADIATSATRLAEQSLTATKEYVSIIKPKEISKYDDRFYVISKKSKYQEMIHKPDFWWFHIDIMKSNPDPNIDHLAITVSRYWDEYFLKGKLWKGKESPTE
jgi:AbiV family abortive infection protein